MIIHTEHLKRETLKNQEMLNSDYSVGTQKSKHALSVDTFLI